MEVFPAPFKKPLCIHAFMGIRYKHSERYREMGMVFIDLEQPRYFFFFAFGAAHYGISYS